jgi:diguanylate cyclase (GGDEF)-like protein
LTASALGVHVSGGLLEAHASFFLVIVVLALYEDWSVFLLAVGFVLVHHGLMAWIEPAAIFDGSQRIENPFKFVVIHTLFIGAGGVAGVVTWAMNEDARRRTFEIQDRLRDMATTDSLTGLRNRRGLMEDLEVALASAPAVLVMFDLDGFKSYNDTFGHLAGDALLNRLGRRLQAAMEFRGTSYRLGGDEFCVLSRGAADEGLVGAAAAALSETGESFTISSSYGAVLLGTEATGPEEALRIADERMYAQKNGGRRSAGDQSKSVLMMALAERHPALGVHVGSVAETAEAVARRLGVPEDRIESVRQAAELHDVGKVAIPDALLAKPGPLEEDEWEFMHRHTLIGERIVAAAPALTYVSRLVRSSHERWDGGGYPDALAGTDIPLGSRIVAVCDAYDAIVATRPYSAARTVEEALAELDRCAGSHFDPTVVAAFIAVARAGERELGDAATFVATVSEPSPGPAPQPLPAAPRVRPSGVGS